jgi:hypothetical protein
MDEVKTIRDKAVAMEVYAYQAKDKELVGYAIEVRERAERRLGELMETKRQAGELAKGARGNPKGRGAKIVQGTTDPAHPTLASQNVDKNLAKRARKSAALTEDKFEQHVSAIIKRGVDAVEQSRQTKRVQSWSGAVEWYTPREYLDLAVEVMGSIDLEAAALDHDGAVTLQQVSRNSFSSIWRASRSAATESNSPAMFMSARGLLWA